MRGLAALPFAVLASFGFAAQVAAQNIEPVADPLEQAIAEGPLLPSEVLRSSALTFPSILESFEREAAARSDQLSADGAFDLILKAEAYDRVTGTFSGGFAEVGASQPLRPLGAEVYGSYRISDGRFPIYENFYNTNQAGELKVGALFSLLRDRRIDKRRFAIEDTRIAASQASLDVLLVQLKVQHDALKAYWYWLAAGREIGVYEELLEIAQARTIGLTREVRAGAKPRIALTENEQNVIRRKTLLTEAQRNFTNASNSLSYFLRDSAGRMITPTREQLPDTSTLEALPDMQSLLSQEVSDVMDNRPELQNFRLAMERATNKIELRRNDLQPKLEVGVELSRDFGAVGDGGSTFDSTDTVVGVKFTVPLQRREARGRLQRAEAELREMELREQRVSDQIEVELGNILTNLNASLDLADLAGQEVEQASAMVAAERKRFSLGAGDFFLVNLREESAADAQVRAIRADLKGRLAAASYSAATMDLDELGLN
ncbi:TolC family protein [Erythrobacter insulae]|uniref:TolC family protein n=1 Tax=Erythrobacter insulae TaxID=2584124 RepID=A0A547PCV6_9SPHN|nr:TolC family protein [Erythrobacter insulae]TRD11972.1 TolC family protein [Erythrobacter insulae]